MATLERQGPLSRAPVEPGPSSRRRAFETTLIVLGTVVVAVALWKLKILVALLLAAVTISAAMRPGVEWLAAHRVPRAVGVLLHYLALLAVIALLLWLVVPRLMTEVTAALAVKPHAHPSSGIKEKILLALQRHLHHLPAAGKLLHPALSAGEEALKVVAAIMFTFAGAAYWLFERDRAVDLVAGFLDRPRRKKFRDTWDLIEMKLGAFIRGTLLMISIVAVLASTAFALVGEPYWLLIGIIAALLEVIPIIGPFLAFVLAVGAGLTASWHIAVFAGAALLGLRLIQDTLLSPRVLGGAVGLPPLIVMSTVFGVGILLGSFYVILAVPIAALLVTVGRVMLLGVDPAEEETPAVLFSPGDPEAG
jgi:predicted PurR-regulated permease PerM